MSKASRNTGVFTVADQSTVDPKSIEARLKSGSKKQKARLGATPPASQGSAPDMNATGRILVNSTDSRSSRRG